MLATLSAHHYCCWRLLLWCAHVAYARSWTVLYCTALYSSPSVLYPEAPAIWLWIYECMSASVGSFIYHSVVRTIVIRRIKVNWYFICIKIRDLSFMKRFWFYVLCNPQPLCMSTLHNVEISTHHISTGPLTSPRCPPGPCPSLNTQNKWQNRNDTVCRGCSLLVSLDRNKKIFYYGDSPKHNGKDLKIPDLQPPDWKKP